MTLFSIWERGTAELLEVFGRLVLPLVRSVLCADLVEAVEERGATWPAMPTAGEMERTGILGGGPGSAPGDRR